MGTLFGTILIIILLEIPIIMETTTTILGEIITLITLIITDITTPITAAIMEIITVATMEDTITTTDSTTTDTIPTHPIITKTEDLAITLPTENEQHLLQEKGMP